MPSYDAVMLIGFGGPTAPAEIRPFLNNVLRGRPLSAARFEAVVHHYETIGGRSPYNDLTSAQAHAVAEMLARSGVALPVVVGMRNWSPYIQDALEQQKRAGARRILGFIMSAFQCEASWERYQKDVEQARSCVEGAPAIDYAPPWHDHPKFIKAIADRLEAALASLSDRERNSAELVFTAHSIPVAMAEKAPYVAQFSETARQVASAAGFDRWTLCYQSRSGAPCDLWLEPDIGEVIRDRPGKVLVIVPAGFLCDHVEVLYDLDIEAAAVARAHQTRLVRARTVGDHPEFIAMMASVIRQAIQ
jgi:ferrochelatase